MKCDDDDDDDDGDRVSYSDGRSGASKGVTARGRLEMCFLSLFLFFWFLSQCISSLHGTALVLFLFVTFLFLLLGRHRPHHFGSSSSTSLFLVTASKMSATLTCTACYLHSTVASVPCRRTMVLLSNKLVAPL